MGDWTFAEHNSVDETWGHYHMHKTLQAIYQAQRGHVRANISLPSKVRTIELPEF
jgi:hypothetical protein